MFSLQVKERTNTARGDTIDVPVKCVKISIKIIKESQTLDKFQSKLDRRETLAKRCRSDLKCLKQSAQSKAIEDRFKRTFNKKIKK